MVKVLTVELCCGKLDQLSCLLLQSSCELLGKLFCQEFTGSWQLFVPYEDLVWDFET